MPEASMHKHHCPVPGKDHVRLARQVSPVQTITETHGKEAVAYFQLGLRILAANRRHHPASSLFAHNVHWICAILRRSQLPAEGADVARGKGKQSVELVTAVPLGPLCEPSSNIWIPSRRNTARSSVRSGRIAAWKHFSWVHSATQLIRIARAGITGKSASRVVSAAAL